MRYFEFFLWSNWLLIFPHFEGVGVVYCNFFQIIWDWDLSEEEEALEVVVEARNCGRESSQNCLKMMNPPSLALIWTRFCVKNESSNKNAKKRMRKMTITLPPLKTK